MSRKVKNTYRLIVTILLVMIAFSACRKSNQDSNFLEEYLKLTATLEILNNPPTNSTQEREVRLIAWAGEGSGPYNLYSVDADGNNPVQLTTEGDFGYGRARVSPDGTKVVYQSYFRDSNNEVYIMNIDGSGQTNISNHANDDTTPSFSPDGTKILFLSTRSGTYETYTMNTDGSNVVRLTNNGDTESEPVFSHDGEKIYFSVSTVGSDHDIAVMDADGSNYHRLISDSPTDSSPSLSPDGTQIVFTSTRSGNYDIFRMDIDGGNLTNLTNTGTGQENNPSYAPDSSRIFYNKSDLHSMQMDGSGQTNLNGGVSYTYNMPYPYLAAEN